MNAPFKTLANPLMRDVGPATPRVPEPFIELDLSEDTVIVSADGHWELDGDVFIDAFPAHLKDEAPRVWFDRYLRVGYPGKMETYPTTEAVVRGVQLNIGPGANDIDVRLAHMAAEGIAQEILGCYQANRRRSCRRKPSISCVPTPMSLLERGGRSCNGSEDGIAPQAGEEQGG